MLSLNSKTCTKFSLIFLACCLPSIISIFITWFMWRTFPVFVEQVAKNWLFIYYSLYLFSGLSLIFSTGAQSKKIKWLVICLHFSCVYGIVLFLLGFVGIKRFDVLIAILAYLLLSLWLLKNNHQKTVAIICLGLPMLLSIVFFIRINYSLLSSSYGWEMFSYVILLSLSGLIGLILSSILENGKMKWWLILINYLFATYFHVVIWILGL
jgi:hypothetical protein